MTEKQYFEYFVRSSHLFITKEFIALNRHKVEKVLFLTDESRRIGIVLGIDGTIAKSPFSAPFGGIHYKNEIMHSSEIDLFVDELIACLQCQEVEEFRFTLPPDLYEQQTNAKLVSSFWRKGLVPNLPEITQWIDLEKFDGSYPRNVKEILRTAHRHGLKFNSDLSDEERKTVYEIIRKNRVSKNRPIYLSLEDLASNNTLFPVDFAMVTDSLGVPIAGSIFYRCHPSIVYAVYWGDTEDGRSVHAMDFMADSLWKHYKEQGFSVIDLGISTESGVPNPGLLRFKESHCAVSSLRYSFTIAIPKCGLSHESLA